MGVDLEGGGGGVAPIRDVTEGGRFNLRDIKNWVNGAEVVREFNQV